MFNRWNVTPPYDNSKVTIELDELIKSGVNIWGFEYPSYYQGDAKRAFEQKVIDHYRFRQIGQETPARWLHYFQTRIREIMPYYIQRYKSVEIMDAIEDPFGNVDIVETFEQESTDTSNGSSSSTANGTASSSRSESGTSSNARNESGTSASDETSTKTDTKSASESKEHKFSNTPQGYITNIDNYLTEASKDNNQIHDQTTGSATLKTENETSNDVSESGETSSQGEDESTSSMTSTGTNETSSTGNVKHTLTRKGNQGVNTYAHDMIEFRQSFINVDMEVINELNDLFLLVY